MKKILFLVFVLLAIFSGVTSAHFNRIYHESGTTLESYYSTRYIEYDDENIGVMFFFKKNFIGNVEGNNISLGIHRKLVKSKIGYNDIVLTMKNPPKFEVHKNNSVKIITLKNMSQLQGAVIGEDGKPIYNDGRSIFLSFQKKKQRLLNKQRK